MKNILNFLNTITILSFSIINLQIINNNSYIKEKKIFNNLSKSNSNTNIYNSDYFCDMKKSKHNHFYDYPNKFTHNISFINYGGYGYKNLVDFENSYNSKNYFFDGFFIIKTSIGGLKWTINNKEFKNTKITKGIIEKYLNKNSTMTYEYDKFNGQNARVSSAEVEMEFIDHPNSKMLYANFTSIIQNNNTNLAVYNKIWI